MGSRAANVLFLLLRWTSPSSRSVSRRKRVLVTSGSNTRRETEGEGGRDVAGEKTPTPESSRSETKYSFKGTSEDVSGTGVDPPLSLSALKKELLASVVWACSREASWMCMSGGSRIACTVCLSLVDALTTSTTPRVLAIVYEAMSYIDSTQTAQIKLTDHTMRIKIIIGSRRTKASARKV